MGGYESEVELRTALTATISRLRSAQLPRHNRHAPIRANRDIADAYADQTVRVTVGNEKLDECVPIAGRDGATPRQTPPDDEILPSHPPTTGRITGMRTGGRPRRICCYTATSNGVIDPITL
jgi:hypothetical protein